MNVTDLDGSRVANDIENAEHLQVEKSFIGGNSPHGDVRIVWTSVGTVD